MFVIEKCSYSKKFKFKICPYSKNVQNSKNKKKIEKNIQPQKCSRKHLDLEFKKYNKIETFEFSKSRI
jgi:hypothetical protein